MHRSRQSGRFDKMHHRGGPVMRIVRFAERGVLVRIGAEIRLLFPGLGWRPPHRALRERRLRDLERPGASGYKVGSLTSCETLACRDAPGSSMGCGSFAR